MLGAALGAIGGVASAGISAAAAKAMQERQIKWERERATNAHQWEVQDLKAAGLNPILSAGGQGATTGGISAPQVDTSGISSAGQAFSDKQKRDIERKRVKQEGQQIDANIEKTELENETTELQNELLKSQLPSAQKEADMKNKYLNSKVGKTLHYIGMGMGEISPLVGGAIGGGTIGLLNKATTAVKARRQQERQQAKANKRHEANFYPTGGPHKFEGEYVSMDKGFYRK